MNKKIINFSVFMAVGYFFVWPQAAKAVMPPDFIFNIGTQIAQFFSVIVIFFTAIFGASFRFFKTKFYALKHRKKILISFILLIAVISLAASYFYAVYKQKSEYQKWLVESKEYEANQVVTSNNSLINTTLDSDGDGLVDAEEIKYGTDPNNPDTDGDTYQDGAEVKGGYNPKGPGKIGEELKNLDGNDQLNIGNDNADDFDSSLGKFISKVNLSDNSAKFINEYYENIANGNLERAYEMSKQTVSFNTFQSWYLKTTKIVLDKLVRIDAQKSSIELILYEGNTFTRYGVLMTLNLKGLYPISVDKSEVKILAQGSIVDKNISFDNKAISKEYNFFTNNETTVGVIKNQEFKKITDSARKDYIVLDARENIEYENGYFPGSLHIRFADLKAGRWLELPKDKFIYVICWSGMRGKEVAEFLRAKKIVAAYLENGANGWVEFGGQWQGSINFGEKYADDKYQVVFDTAEVKKKVKEGVILVDTREPYKFEQWHIAGSINIPIMYTSTIKVEEVFAQVPAGSKIITVCDGYINCFDAKITGVELERRGHQFLGRYNKPWEYEK
jgi:rhodanese-related sulfurtransferase